MKLFHLSRLMLGCTVLTAAAPYLAAAPPATHCADLTRMQLENASISEAVDVPAGKPVSVGASSLLRS